MFHWNLCLLCFNELDITETATAILLQDLYPPRFDLYVILSRLNLLGMQKYFFYNIFTLWFILSYKGRVISRIVRHIGGAMRGAGADLISVLVRTMVESKASKNALRLFYALGYKLDHELLRVGFSFHFYRGAQITVTVSSVNKLPKLHAVDEAEPVTPGIQLVEVTAPATSDNYGEVVTAVSSFCEYLAP